MITQEQIEKVVNIIKNVSTPKAIFLFGSYAAGDPRENSDLDIAVIKSKTDNQYDEAYSIRKELFGHNIPMDLLFFEEENYEARKSVFGTVQYEIAHKGKKLL